jgi:hypothetical protein
MKLKTTMMILDMRTFKILFLFCLLSCSAVQAGEYRVFFLERDASGVHGRRADEPDAPYEASISAPSAAAARRMVLHDDPDAVQIIIHWNGVTEPSAAEVSALKKESRRSDVEATKAMNRLQNALGKPHVASVWYNEENNTYNWVGPKLGRQMSEPANEFLSEVGPYF